MYLYIIFINLFNSLFIGILGHHFGRLNCIRFSLITLISSLLLIIWLLIEVLLYKNIIIINFYDFILISDIKLNISFLFDSLSITMLFVILSISTFVHIFTASYMSHDPFIVRFYTYLGLFTFFMIILVTADNFLQLFVGWEGVGLCSYLLINFWYKRIAANKAAIKAMLMNRIADVFFILGILLVLLKFKSLNFIIIMSLIEFINFEYIYIFFFDIKLIDFIACFFFIGSIGKSAQIGFHTWLPDAMEGPTPVSSLLHAATMVTAGVFLLARCSNIFEQSNFITALILIFGVCTALYASLVATYQYDIKKIIAYSTCSQLGYMFFACGLSFYNVAFFHLFNHAFFKALLFLGAGSIISSLLDEQDLRKMGFLVLKLPFTYISFLIGSLAILGFPFLAGFYSKDLLLELTYTTYSFDGFFIYFLAVSSALFTSIYSFKLIFFVFLHKTNLFNRWNFIEENQIFIIVTLFILSFLSIFIGFIFVDIFVGYGNNYYDNSLYYNFYKFNNIELEFLNPFIKNLPLIVGFLGVFISYIFFYKLNIKFFYINFFFIKKYLYLFFFNAAFFNYFYNKILNIFIYIFYILNIKNIEKGFFEFFGPTGLYLYFRNLSLKARTFTPVFINISIISLYLFLIFIFIYGYIYLAFIPSFIYIIFIFYLIYN